jgi:hypothetical protein
MSHFIQPENVSTLRNKYLNFVALTILALNKKNEFDMEAKDMTAFIILLLNEIQNNINRTVQAWEKRDYWVKADQFKREWQWCLDYAVLLSKALKESNWSLLKNTSFIIEGKCNKSKLSKKLLITSPWEGAYAKLKKELR